MKTPAVTLVGWTGLLASLSLAALVAGCATPAARTGYAPETSFRETPMAPAPEQPTRPRIPPPRVMIIVDEQSLGTIATAETEAMAIRKLSERGVPTVDQDMVRANLARGQQILQQAGDNRGAAALGAQFGADVVIVGEAVAKPSARRIADTNLRSYQAVVTLRAIRTDNAASIAAASEDATQVGLEDVSGSAKALRAAAEKTLDRLIPELLAKWSADAATAAFSHAIELTVGGVDQIWKVRAVRDLLRERAADVRNVVQRSYTTGVAVFSMESKRPAEELAEELVLSPPEGLKFQVLDVSAGRIQLRAVDR